MNGFSTDLRSQNVEIDAGIKGLLALILAVAACFCDSGWDLLCFTVYLLAVTFLLKSDLKFIMINIASYGITFVLPYICGLSLSWLMGALLPETYYMPAFEWESTAIRTIRIFFIWYISSLYFFTTPFVSIASMLNKILSPLNRWGIPVNERLNMVLCIVNELAQSVTQFKQDVFEQANEIFKSNHLGIKAKLSALAGILADFIANSLQRTDRIPSTLVLVKYNSYELNIVRNEIWAISSLLIFLWFFFACL